MSDSEKLFFELKSDVPPSAQEYHDSKRDDGSGSVEPSLPAFAQSESNLTIHRQPRYLDISLDDLRNAEHRLRSPRQILEHLAAMSVSGIDISFYAFPLVVARAGIYSPLCLLTASLLHLLFRPVLLELVSTARIGRSNYIYFLQFSGKTIALIGAAATILDAVTTPTVSTATASAYPNAEVYFMPISASTLAVIFLVALGVLALAWIKENSSAQAAIIAMISLAVAGIVRWVNRDSNSIILKQNWSLRPSTAIETARAIFYGVCIAFLGVTGFECTPSYIEMIRPPKYSALLRNVIVVSAVLNTLFSLLSCALLPMDIIANGSNVLSALGSLLGGNWFRKLVFIDAVSVLLGGVITGTATAIELLYRKAHDQALPHWFGLRFPTQGSQHIATLFSTGLSLLLYVGSGMNLLTVSYVFSFAIFLQLLLFAVSSLLLDRSSPPRLRRGMITLLMPLVATILRFPDNIALGSISFGVGATSFAVVCIALLVTNAQPIILRLALRLYSASTLRQWRFTQIWYDWSMSWYKARSTASVCIWIKNDSIGDMFRAVLSVKKDIPSARAVIFVHAYRNIDEIPIRELNLNATTLAESAPAITIDFAFVSGKFSPTLVEATSRALGIPRSRMYVVPTIHGRDFDELAG